MQPTSPNTELNRPIGLATARKGSIGDREMTPASNQNESILIVDDTPANLYLLEEILLGAGYRVRALPSSTLVMRSVEAHPPALILLDIKMPGYNGLELCAQLKTHAIAATIPIIFISALQEPGDKAKAYAIGGVDYITKPFLAEEVLARVATHLQLRRSERALSVCADRQRHLIDAIDQPLLGVDGNAQLIFINTCALRLLDYQRKDLQNATLSVILPSCSANGADGDCSIVTVARHGGRQVVAADSLRHRDGSPIAIDYTAININCAHSINRCPGEAAVWCRLR